MFELIQNGITNHKIGSQVIGLVRSLLALNTLLLLTINSAVENFAPFGQTKLDESPLALMKYNFFLLGESSYITLMNSVAIGLLFLVVIGYKPRWTALPHWWISASFATASMSIDGGDQINAVLSLFLVPICLLDPRHWHWQSDTVGSMHYRWISFFVYGLIRFQVAMVYFQASTAKFSVPEWANGTAVYYWAFDPMMGMPFWARDFFMPILTNSLMITLLTYGVLALEIGLFCALFQVKKIRYFMLPLGIAFHIGIIFLHGLGPFWLNMTAALILLMVKPGEGITFPKLDFKKISAAVLSVTSAFTLPSCSDPASSEIKIIGGNEEIPLRIQERVVHVAPFCSGILIDHKTVMTAAHCVIARRFTRIMRLPNKEPRLAVVDIHPGFNPSTYPYQDDLAILRLTEPFSNLQPVQSSTLLNQENLSIVGWGTTIDGVMPSLSERKPRVLKMDGAEYKRKGKLLFYKTFSEKGTCHGDSGGPLLSWDEKVIYFHGLVIGADPDNHDGFGGAGVMLDASSYQQTLSNALTHQPIALDHQCMASASNHGISNIKAQELCYSNGPHLQNCLDNLAPKWGDDVVSFCSEPRERLVLECLERYSAQTLDRVSALALCESGNISCYERGLQEGSLPILAFFNCQTREN